MPTERELAFERAAAQRLARREARELEGSWRKSDGDLERFREVATSFYRAHEATVAEVMVLQADEASDYTHLCYSDVRTLNSAEDVEHWLKGRASRAEDSLIGIRALRVKIFRKYLQTVPPTPARGANPGRQRQPKTGREEPAFVSKDGRCQLFSEGADDDSGQ